MPLNQSKPFQADVFVRASNQLALNRWGWCQSALAGGVHALALSPWGASWPWLPALLQSGALAWLLTLLVRPLTPGSAAMLTWFYGTTWLIGATGWMFVSLHRFGGLPAWLSGGAVLLLCMALSAYMAAVGWVWARWRRGVWWRDALAWGGLWILAEWARAVLLTGFPWGASGYGLLDSPMRVLAPLVGVYGLGGVWAGVLAWGVFGALRAEERIGPRVLPLGITLLALGALWGLGRAGGFAFTHPHGKSLSVTLLQSNVPQDEKFVTERLGPMLWWHEQQLLAAQTTLVIAPETAIPLLPSQQPQGYWEEVAAGFPAGAGRFALIGVPLGSFEHGYTNSLVGFGGKVTTLNPEAQGGPYRYDKHHLVPFGEFIPFGFRWFVALMNMPLGDFSRGPLVAPSFEVTGQRLAPTICYEDLFGEEIAARFVDTTRPPTVLANVSNLAWFGESVAIHQHLQIARMRSLEFQVPTIRSTNTGATVVIDHLGRVVAQLPGQTRGALVSTVQGMEGVTPYAWWAGRWGLWPLFVLAFALWCAGRRWARH